MLEDEHPIIVVIKKFSEIFLRNLETKKTVLFSKKKLTTVVSPNEFKITHPQMEELKAINQSDQR